MDYNLVNGGLIAFAGDEPIVSDFTTFRTTYRSVLDGMCWFMNVADTRVYYSDQRRRNAICFLDLEDGREHLILDQPSYGIVWDQGWLVYLNEEDGCIYRSDANGKQRDKLFGEKSSGFLLAGGLLYAATNRGIVCQRMDGAERELITDGITCGMVMAGGKLAYADHANRGRLTLVDTVTGQIDVMHDYVPISLNTDGHYLYCSNVHRQRSIYRIDPERMSGIRICGWHADYLHVIDDELYFVSNREWHRMSLSGGQPRKVVGDA